MMRIACLLLLCAVGTPLIAAGDATDAARAYLDAGRYAEAIAAVRDRIAEAPRAGEGWRTLGHALAATGEVEEALAAYRRVPPGADGPPLDVEMAMARLEGVYGDAAGDPGAGRARTRRVLAAYRERGHARLSARELVAAGDAARDLAREDPALYAMALRIYEQAIRRAPDDPATHVAIADLLLDRYNNEEALEAYRAALERDAQFVPALRGIAHSLHFDHSAGALDATRRALEVRPTDVGSLVLLARLHLELEAYSEAEQTIERALAVNPRSPEALTLTAALAFLRGDKQTFEARVARVRAIAPGYVALYQTLAEVAAQNRYYAAAERFARRAVSLDDHAWRAHALLGVNRLRLGRMEAGRAALESAFRGDPYDARTKNALELLDRLDGFGHVRSARFVLVADPREARVLAPRLLPIAERAYDHYAGAYGYRPATPVRVELYRRHEDFSVRTTGLVGVDIMGVSFGPVVALDSPSAAVFGPVNVGSVLWHEIAHTFHLGLTGSRVPRWFSEGLAVFEERRARPGWGFDVSPGFLVAFREGRLAPASALNQAFLRPRYPEQIAHAYLQSALVMELIARDHGFEAIVRMLEGYRDGRSTAELLRDVLGREAQAFDAAFDAFVRERFGHALEALAPVADAEDGPMPQGRYPHLLREARLALAAGELERAFAALTEAQALFPEHGGGEGTYHMLAGLHLRRGEPERAIEQLERAIAIDADDLEAHERLAGLHRETGDAGAAASVLERALLIQPFDANLYRTLAGLRESRGEWESAAEAREAVVALDPSDPAGARYHLARAHHRAGNAAAARRAVLGALEIAPLYEEALELLLLLRELSGAPADPRGARRAQGEESGPNGIGGGVDPSATMVTTGKTMPETKRE
ncbi:MAG: tetratricopeptide repeat protein [Gammaproteobacteria bacterium]|nr:tetratricopeptide repeat protein [Gammaproteobacteria bacterium]NIR82414.1 tetratricopeptide repeat protein [Gammaproteobacteria bacterium]NIR91995.1 tetratricopeptide repeat protein [Gammaproteobacteria bacterium]NIU03551.1 tetratricopeptide repeat protein [Gammaproteobacteria bacterium]NIX84825.1 tetratricopeptide repeat protein [Gammaproteobacteria bacterium]